MCNRDNCGCTHPEKKDPKECSPEQIRECHGDVEEHPCQGKEEEGEDQV